jgi:hypothetical protein
MLITNENWNLHRYEYPNFTQGELRCSRTLRIGVSLKFLCALQLIRDALSAPMIVTSGCRSTEYNEFIKGHERSLHIYDQALYPSQEGALAVDIATVDAVYRGRLFSVAWDMGWSIGWNGPRRFLHLDRRDWVGLPQTTFDY